jgi:DNA/RNA-binding domain of Phe-tRNA-synthetase-like protein
VNAFALQHVLPAAAYDMAAVQGDLWLRPSRGVERFEPLEARSAVTPPINELILVDSGDAVLSRHWHGAQGRTAAAGPRTEDALVHLDLLPPLAATAGGLADAFGRLAHGFTGADVEWRLLDRAAPQAAWPRCDG